MDDQIRQTGLFTIVFLFCLSLSTILFYIFYTNDEPALLIAGVFMFIFSLATLITVIRWFNLRRKRNHLMYGLYTPTKPKKRKYRKNIDFEINCFSEDDNHKEITCMICKLPITPKKEFIQCPFCNANFHVNHLLEWLELDDNCPVCNKSLKK